MPESQKSVVLDPSQSTQVDGAAAKTAGEDDAHRGRTLSRLLSPVSRSIERGGYWVVPVLVAFALSVWRIGRPGLWRDELFTWERATRSVPDILSVIHEVDSVFIPYYLAMHVWTELFGTSPVALRLPSALGMTASAGIVALLGKRLFTPTTGVIGGLIFAFLPAISRYGQEAKPHIFATLFTSLATLLLLRALEKPQWSRWVPYAAACTAIGFCHLLAFVVVFGHGVAVVALEWQRNRSILVKWATAAAASTVPVLVLAVAGFTNRGAMAWLPFTTVRSVFDYPVRLMSGSIFDLAGAGVLAGAILTLGVIGVATTKRPASWILGVLALLPPLMLITAGRIEHVYHPRYLLYTVVAWAVLAAATVVALRPVFAVPLFVAIVALGIPSQLVHRQTNGHGDPEASAIADVVAADSRPGDGVIFQASAGNWLALGSEYYMARLEHEGASTNRTALPTEECGPSQQCRVDTSRVWVICLGRHTDALECLSPEKADAVRQAYRTAPVRVHQTARFTLALYQSARTPS
jgi:mannosyltransferase